MKQQFIGLQHCKCGISWKKDIGYFERTPDMIFALDRMTVGKKTKQVPVIRYKLIQILLLPITRLPLEHKHFLI